MLNSNNFLIREFLDYLKIEKGLSENTIKSYKVDLKEFSEFTDTEFNNITKEHIYSFLEQMREKYKHNTRMRKTSSIKSFFKYLYMNKSIEKDPTNTIKTLKKEKRLPDILKEEEFKKIINTFNHEPKNVRDVLILKLLIATGARISEIINLDIKDIEDNEFKYIKVLGKGSKYRFIPLYEQVANEIKDYIEKVRPELLRHRKDYKLFPGASRTLFYIKFRKQAKQAGIEKNVHPHMIRHSIASLLLKNGADIKFVQEILGHASITTTQIYTHIEKSKLKSIYDKVNLGEIDED